MDGMKERERERERKEETERDNLVQVLPLSY